MATSSQPENLMVHEKVRHLADVPIMCLLGVGLLFLAAFFNLTSLDPDKTIVALDLQVVLKLAVVALAGMYGLLGLLGDPRVRQIVVSFPGAWITVIFGFYCVSIVGALDPESAIASTGSILCIFLMTVTALVRLGRKQVTETIFFAAAVFVVGSWFAYFMVPELGVFFEPTSDARFVKRMSGLSHPNTLGQFSALTVVLGTVLFVNYQQRSYIRILIIALAAGALIMSLSRASIFACVTTLAYVYRDLIFRPQNKLRYLWMAAAGLVLVIIASTQVDFGRIAHAQLAALAKSGDTAELTSATGRAEIWQESIGLIGARPLTGYGPASSKVLLEEYSHYTHNMLLNVALSTGVIGGLAMLVMMLSRIKLLFQRRHPVADGLVVLILVNGLVENVMFSTLCGLPTIAWVIGLVWFQVGQLDGFHDEFSDGNHVQLGNSI